MELSTPKQIELSEVFLKEPWREFTFKEIKEMNGSNSVNAIYTLLKKLEKNNILISKPIGNNISYKIAYTFEAYTYFSYVAESMSQNQKYIPLDNIRKLFDKLNENYLTILITGSYAINKQTKNSDLDVVIICPNSLNPQKIEAEISTECELMIPKVHLMVFSEKEFIQMLLSKKENFGKECIRKNLIIYGANNYLKLIKEATANGWNSRYLLR